MKSTLLVLLATHLTFTLNVRAGGATWNLNPISSDWTISASWTPATVPNGPSDIATFDVSNGMLLSVEENLAADSILFNNSASPFFIQLGDLSPFPSSSILRPDADDGAVSLIQTANSTSPIMVRASERDRLLAVGWL